MLETKRLASCEPIEPIYELILLANPQAGVLPPPPVHKVPQAVLTLDLALMAPTGTGRVAAAHLVTVPAALAK